MPTEFLNKVSESVDMSREYKTNDLVQDVEGMVRFVEENKKVVINEYDTEVVEVSFWEGDELAGPPDYKEEYTVNSDGREVADSINKFF